MWKIWKCQIRILCPFAMYHQEFDMLKNTAEMQNWLAWWTQDGRAVTVVPLHRSLCWFHHVHLVMFFTVETYCKCICNMFQWAFTITNLSLFKHIVNGQKSAIKSLSISQLDIILTPNWYKLTPNPLFPTCLVHILQSWPKIHNTFCSNHNKNVKHVVTF